MNLLLLCSTLLTVALLSVGDAARLSSHIPGEGPSAVGAFDIEGDQGRKLHIEFFAATALDGRTTGETTFQDESETPAAVTVEAHSKDEQLKRFSFRAEFDCLVVDGNKAVMGGTVTQASWERYIGRRVLVVTEENGDPSGSAKRDKVTWGIYREPVNDQITSDAERPDEISGRTWLATDAERAEDGGVLSNQKTVIGCQSFPMSAFTFVAAKQTKGTVQVRAR